MNFLYFQPKERAIDAEKDIFLSLEKFNGFKIPDCVKTILRYCAYDTACSLAELNEKHISGIEDYVNQSNGIVIRQLTCCNAETYRNQDRFRFLPGHSSILLGFPAQVRKINESKKKPYKKVSEFKKLLTPAELQSLLLNKINQHIEKCGLIQQFGSFNTENLSPVQSMITNNTMLAKCNVKCSKCDNVTAISYNGSWCTSNVFRHLKSPHISTDIQNNNNMNNLVDNANEGTRKGKTN